MPLPPSRSRRMCRAFGFGLLALFVLLSAPAVPDATAQDARLQRPEKPLILSVSAPAGALSLGEEASVTLLVTNTSNSVIEGVTLHLPQRPAVSWLGTPTAPITYDLLDRPTSVTLPNGETVLTTYDHEGENALTAGGTALIDDVGFTALGQLALLQRPGATPDTFLDYHPQADNYRLSAIRHGTAGDGLPDYGYTAYDAAGNLTGMTMRTGSTTETSAFGYDELNRLKTASLTGAGAANYTYTYAYDQLGNLTKRTGTDPDLVSYGYGNRAASGSIPAMTGGPQAVTYIDVGGTTTDWRYDYDPRGNLDARYAGSTLTHDYAFDVENRLTSVTLDGATTTFTYDADGQRVKAVYSNRTVYTPFSDYEITDNGSDGSIDAGSTTYRLAGRIVAVRTSGTISHVAFDHLGSVGALFDATGTIVPNSLTRFDPFGNFRTTPAGSNPLITNQGFTGHRHNNTGSPDLGLIYMNARYYLPEVGRFISPDSIVPDPSSPQSYNRYAYALNSPVNLSDPTGHYSQTAIANIDGSVQGFGALVVYGAAGTSISYVAVQNMYRLAQDHPEAMWAIHEAAEQARQGATTDVKKALGGGGTASPNPDPNDPNHIQDNDTNWRDLVPAERQETIQEAFEGDPQVVSTKEDTIIYRYHNAGESGTSSWLSPKSYSTPLERQQYLALPKSNEAVAETRYVLPRGTRVLYGEVKSKAGDIFFHPHATGGGMQCYVPDVSKLIALP